MAGLFESVYIMSLVDAKVPFVVAPSGFAFPDLVCSVCQQAAGDNRRECDSCHAIACQICAKTEWHWKESSHDIRHKCRECRQRAMTSSIVQHCLERAQESSSTNPSLSAGLYDCVLPWLPKDQKAIVERRRNECQGAAVAQQKSLDAILHILERRAQEKTSLHQYETALELWGALYEVRPNDEHICKMMVKTQVLSNDVENGDSHQLDIALEFLKMKLSEAFETECYALATILCELALKFFPNDSHLMKKLTEAELKRSDQLERFQPSPVAAIKTMLQMELDAARDQGDTEREASLMRVLQATLIQEHRHYQALGKHH